MSPSAFVQCIDVSVLLTGILVVLKDTLEVRRGALARRAPALALLVLGAREEDVDLRGGGGLDVVGKSLEAVQVSFEHTQGPYLEVMRGIVDG